MKDPKDKIDYDEGFSRECEEDDETEFDGMGYSIGEDN